MKLLKMIKSWFAKKQPTWAECEVALACKRENPNWDGKSFDYGCACYQSALKAYKCLEKDQHSGMSWSITTGILTRLMNGLPLTPITEDDFVGVAKSSLSEEYQCSRMSSLFENIAKDGTITYSDIDRQYCVNADNPKNTFNSWKDKVVDELFPITLPYYPVTGKYKVYTRDFLLNKKNGDYDTSAVLYIVTPDGEKVKVNRYYKEDKKTHKFVQISKKEYDARYEGRVK